MLESLGNYRQPESWLYEIKQKGQEIPYYVMVPNASVCPFK